MLKYEQLYNIVKRLKIANIVIVNNCIPCYLFAIHTIKRDPF